MTDNLESNNYHTKYGYSDKSANQPNIFKIFPVMDKYNTNKVQTENRQHTHVTETTDRNNRQKPGKITVALIAIT